MKTINLPKTERIDWVDYAKGICIIAVVSMYATGDVERAMNGQGWMHYFTLFAKPFRMPDFFFLSGLFVAHVINRPWRAYLDTKVLHFMYFYTVWMTIKFILGKSQWHLGASWLEFAKAYAYLYFHPTGPLWFIFMLALFFIAVRLLRAFPVPLIFLLALLLRLAEIDTDIKLIDRFGMYFIFFYSGHIFAPHVFRLARWAEQHTRQTATILVIWFITNIAWIGSGVTDVPIAHLIAAFAGALAVLLLATMLTGFAATRWIRYLGANSIIVYLGFVIPVSLLPEQIVKYQLITDIGTASLITIVVSILSAIVLYQTVRNTPFRFLFVRPLWATINTPPRTEIKPVVTVRSSD